MFFEEFEYNWDNDVSDVRQSAIYLREQATRLVFNKYEYGKSNYQPYDPF